MFGRTGWRERARQSEDHHALARRLLAHVEAVRPDRAARPLVFDKLEERRVGQLVTCLNHAQSFASMRSTLARCRVAVKIGRAALGRAALGRAALGRAASGRARIRPNRTRLARIRPEPIIAPPFGDSRPIRFANPKRALVLVANLTIRDLFAVPPPRSCIRRPAPLK